MIQRACRYRNPHKIGPFSGALFPGPTDPVLGITENNGINMLMSKNGTPFVTDPP